MPAADNKPLPAEVRTCNAYLQAELAAMPRLKVIVALGTVGHGAVLMALGLKPSAARFAHGARHALGGIILYDSYHCSRYNQNTRRLTPAMFRAVFAQAASEAGAGQDQSQAAACSSQGNAGQLPSFLDPTGGGLGAARPWGAHEKKQGRPKFSREARRKACAEAIRMAREQAQACSLVHAHPPRGACRIAAGLGRP
jgi:Uracil-DNA glycosylase